MRQFLESLPPVLRHVVVALWGASFILVGFVLAPSWAADFNHEHDWLRWRSPAGRGIGVALVLGGIALSVYCSRLFQRLGKGTPVPIDPPRELVVAGLYRFTRNPIYVAQVAVLLGYFFYSGEIALLAYAGFWALLVQAFVVWVEEPDLGRRFGEAYLQYTRDVPRWLGPRRGSG